MDEASPPPRGAGPPTARPPVRWGLGDFAWVYFVGVFAAQFAGTIGLAIEGLKPGESAGALTLGLSAAGLYGAWAAGLIYASHRKGRGSLAVDFGLVVRAFRVWVLLAGVVLQVVLGAMVLPLVSLAGDEKQSVVDELQKASGAKHVVLIIVAGFFAPVFEELVFRGLLLRALRRRFSVEWAIGLSALLFAVGHLLDPSLGTVAVLPALFALGVISGLAAVWVGDLSVSIPLHVGFNLVTLAAYATVFR